VKWDDPEDQRLGSGSSPYMGGAMEWFDKTRRIIIFLLGAFCFFKGVVSPENTIPELIIGMIMVGVLPIDDFFIWSPRARRKRERDTEDSDRN